MLINTPISLGELVDKISILIIKKKNISDSIKLEHVTKELDFLQKTLKLYLNSLLSQKLMFLYNPKLSLYLM